MSKEGRLVQSTLEEYLEHAWLEIGDVAQLDIENRMIDPIWDDASKIPELIIETCRNPEYFQFFLKYVLNVDIFPYQGAILQTLWNKPLIQMIATRGGSKSFCIALYIAVKAVLHQGCTIAVVGASFRQSLVIFDYLNNIWNNAPVLRDICGGRNFAPKKEIHRASWQCGNSKAIFLPLGNGETIRGQRANVVICDEFSSISDSVFSTVVRGFASTKEAGSIHGSVVKAAKKRVMKERGITLEENIKDNSLSILTKNQIIIAGTASYQFNHFYRYYKQYKTIIESGGDKDILRKEFPDMTFDTDINSEDYAIIKLPWDALPEGMLDETIIQQAKATMDPIIFGMEYGAVFPADSDGFFLASYINAATCPITLDNGDKLTFGAKKYGDKDKLYIMGVDPASENDYFAICIIEMDGIKRKVVYVWSTNRKDFESMKKEGGIKDGIDDYHTFCIHHIRDLNRRFNIQMIVMDAAGGGVAVREGLKDSDKMLEGEEAILDMDDENNKQAKGSRKLKMIEFSSYQWRRDAHYGLQKDILEKTVIFPEYDIASIEVSNTDEDTFETMEDCYLEITECKTEMTLIQHSSTETGSHEKWEVPKIVGVTHENIKKKLKRDRFTALLLANWGGRLFGVKSYQPSDSSAYKVVRGRNSNTSKPSKHDLSILNAGSKKKIYF